MIGQFLFAIVQSKMIFYGAYEATVTSKNPNDAALLETIFPKDNSLIIQEDKSYTFSDMQRSGYWRREGNDLILIASRSYNLFIPRPKQMLMYETPKSDGIGGLRLRIQPDGSLLLQSLNQIQGTVQFVPKRSLSTLALLKDSDGEAMTPKWSEAVIILNAEADERKEDLLRIFLDTRNDYTIRASSLLALGKTAPTWSASKLRPLLSGYHLPSITTEKKVLLRTVEARLAHDTSIQTSRILFQYVKFIPADVLLTSCIASGYRPSNEECFSLLKSKSGSRSAFARIADLTKSSALIPKCKELLQDKDASTRAWAAIALLNHQATQKGREKFRNIIFEIAKSDGYFDVARQLERLGKEYATTCLIELLRKSSDHRELLGIVNELGSFRSREALPVLKELFERPVELENLREGSELKQYLIDAIANIDLSFAKKLVEESKPDPIIPPR